MITISRMQARRLRSIFCRALNLTPRLHQQPVRFTAGPQGLRVFASLHGFAACYEERLPLPDCALTIPLSLLKETGGSQTEPLLLIPEGDGQVLARWQAGDIPQERRASVSDEQTKFTLPPMPETLLENPPSLRQAMAIALQVTDTTTARYALSCI